MNIFEELKSDLEKYTATLYKDKDIWSLATLEAPKDPLNGDLSTNIAMIVASKEKKNPREIAMQFKDVFSTIPYIAHIGVAGPGFINFTIRSEKWHESLNSILNDDKRFWEINIGNDERVNVEYVSANPTGPMHIGHARGAVYGDILSNILSKCGYLVTKEYYINDAGSQIDTLIDSSIMRYEEVLTGKAAEIPEGLYPGEYLKIVGQKLFDKYQDQLHKIDSKSMRAEVKKIAISEMLSLIKSDLSDLGIHHDIFFSEQSLHDTDKITQSVKILEDKNLIYKGVLPEPKKNMGDDNWEEKEQLLFRSTNYGDSQDRSIQKGDGSWSYLAADFAYAKDKIDRKFDALIYILGADHAGYIKRIEAVIDALGNGKVKSEIKTTQLVNFVKDGEPIKMSKRSGNFMTVRDVTEAVGKDIVRFMMLTRRSDMPLDFDFDKVKEQSKDNPVFYVQYAHVRVKSILQKAQDDFTDAYNQFASNEFDLSLLSSEEELQLIKLLASWAKILSGAAKYFEPHRIAYYLIDVASKFHSVWHLGKENSNYRFNIENNKDLTAARLALAESVRKVIAYGFEVIGVTPMDKM